MRVSAHPCYILHMRHYRETSLLLQVFSREYGRIDLLAKGAKRKSNNNRFQFRLYRRLLLAWVGRGELGTLTHIEPDSTMNDWKLRQIMSGFYLNEILIRLLHKHEAHPDLFEAYDAVLSKLHKDYPEGAIIRYFEKKLLQSLGYGLILNQETAAGGAIEMGDRYYYQHDAGPSLRPPDSNHYIEISGRALIALDQETIDASDEEIQMETKKLMRFVLGIYLGDKPLASRQLYGEYLSAYAG